MKLKKSMSMQPCMAALLILATPLANACGAEDYLGSVCLTAATFCPQGKLEADGRLLSIAQNQQLFRLLGAAYGGNGDTTFALPDLRGRAPVGRAETAAPAGAEKISRGQAAGNASTTLSLAQLPAHSHPFTPTAGSTTAVAVQLQASTTPAKSSAPSATNRFLAPVSGMDSNGSPISAMSWTDTLSTPVTVGGLSATLSGGAGTVGNTGGGQPIPTQSPSLGMLYCIEVRGLYPPSP